MSRKVLASTMFATGVVGLLSFMSARLIAQGGQAPRLFGDLAPASAPFPRNAQDFDKMFIELRNWGRWGRDDQLGTLNLITPEKRRQAAALVKSGISVSLAHNPITEVARDNREGTFERTMSANFRSDTLRFNFHGPITSHMDALCHYEYKGMLYNGIPTSASSAKGCSKLGIERVKNGIVTRGVLIDIPRLRGVEYLEPGTPVYTEEIEAWVPFSAATARTTSSPPWCRRTIRSRCMHSRSSGWERSCSTVRI